MEFKNYRLSLPGAKLGSDGGTLRGGQLDDESEDGDDARDDVAEGQPQLEAGGVARPHLVKLDEDVVAHEGHEGEGGEDGELLEEGKSCAGGRRLRLLGQGLHHHQGEEADQEADGEVHHDLVVHRLEERREGGVDDYRDDEADDGDA